MADLNGKVPVIIKGLMATDLRERGPKGIDGKGIDHIIVNSDYTFTYVYTDGTIWVSPVLKGDKGDPYDDTQLRRDITQMFTNYYTKQEVDTKVSEIPKYATKVVNILPTEDISETTVYLLRNLDEPQNMYTEYIYVDGEWDELGAQTVDLSDYDTSEQVDKKIEDALNSIIDGDEVSF